MGLGLAPNPSPPDIFDQGFGNRPSPSKPSAALARFPPAFAPFVFGVFAKYLRDSAGREPSDEDVVRRLRPSSLDQRHSHQGLRPWVFALDRGSFALNRRLRTSAKVAPPTSLTGLPRIRVQLGLFIDLNL